jgi:xanthine dehydrogenase YagR molybdenum-binding subunit
MSVVAERAVGDAMPRTEGPDKLTGRARYAYEYPLEHTAYAWLVQAPAPRGRVVHVDASDALGQTGVLTVLWHANAPRLGDIDDAELAVLQSDRVAYAGQIVASVVAETYEGARDAAELVRIEIEVDAHHTVLRDDDPRLYAPSKVNPNFPTDTNDGDVDAALADAAVVVDATYRTPALHNNPMEPHNTTACWEGDQLTVYDSNQGVGPVQEALATLFGLPLGDVRVVSPHVGGGFGSKGTPRPIVVAAAMAARVVDRPVKLAASRRQMFAFTGYRTRTIQRARLGADTDGRLTAIAHDVVEQTSTVREFAEQTAVATRMMYAAPNRRTSHRLAALDVPTPSWMRAPGECPGMYALESAMDELAVATGVDPIELRRRNEPAVDPESGRPFSSRNLVACLEEGARRFGWDGRDPKPGVRHDGRWLVGTGVAASTYPARSRPSSAAAVARADGSYVVEVAAADIGTGARTALGQIAADALGVPAERVTLQLGDSALPKAPVAGGSMGTSSWGWAVTKACTELREMLDRLGDDARGDELRVQVDTDDDIEKLDQRYARRAVRGGARRCRQRRGAGAADDRCVRGRPHREPDDRALAAHRRDDDGRVDGADGGVDPRSRVRAVDEQRPRRLPRRHLRRRRRHRRVVDRRGGRRPQPRRPQGHRRDRDRGHCRGGGERGLARDRRARATCRCGWTSWCAEPHYSGELQTSLIQG